MPAKILAMRFQAMGDMVITLPYLLSLKKQLPGSTLHFLTRDEVAEIPRGIELFDNVVVIKGRRNVKVQLLYCLLKLPWLWKQRYDVVIDLQNHVLSNLLLKLLRPTAWSSFDKFSPQLAGERTRLTINALNLYPVQIETTFTYKAKQLTLAVEEKLAKHGWVKTRKLIIINPAGAFQSRHWPMENYIAFCKRWLQQNEDIQFVIMGLPSLHAKAQWLKEQLGNNLINLVDDTNAMEAFAIVQKAHLTLTEDSGLMHMSWVQGIPTLALFGSTRNDWSAPTGKWSICLNSSDLACGNCMQPICQFGDTHCLTRYTPEFVFQESRKLTHT